MASIPGTPFVVSKRQSVLIIPLDQAIHPLVRCKNRNSIRLAAPGGGFSTAKSEITLSNGQIQVFKQRTCIVWITDTPSVVWKRAHHSLGSSNRLTCPLRNLEHVECNGKVWNYAIQRTDTSVRAAHMHCMGHWYSIRGVKACSSFRWIKQFTHLSVAKLLIESKNRGRVIPVLSMYSYRMHA